MSRVAVHLLQDALRAGTAPQAGGAEIATARASALALLDRSIKFGHRRLAIRRLAAAIEIGAPVSGTQWAYCNRVVSDFGTTERRDWAIAVISAAAAIRTGG